MLAFGTALDIGLTQNAAASEVILFEDDFEPEPENGWRHGIWFGKEDRWSYDGSTDPDIDPPDNSLHAWSAGRKNDVAGGPMSSLFKMHAAGEKIYVLDASKNEITIFDMSDNFIEGIPIPSGGPQAFDLTVDDVGNIYVSYKQGLHGIYIIYGNGDTPAFFPLNYPAFSIEYHEGELYVQGNVFPGPSRYLYVYSLADFPSAPVREFSVDGGYWYYDIRNMEITGEGDDSHIFVAYNAYDNQIFEFDKYGNFIQAFYIGENIQAYPMDVVATDDEIFSVSYYGYYPYFKGIVKWERAGDGTPIIVSTISQTRYPTCIVLAGDSFFIGDSNNAEIDVYGPEGSYQHSFGGPVPFDGYLTSPAIELTTASDLRLSFEHSFRFWYKHEGAILEISTDGTYFSQIQSNRIIQNSYDAYMSSDNGNRLAYRWGWTYYNTERIMVNGVDTEPWEEVIVDLSPWEGETIFLRWHVAFNFLLRDWYNSFYRLDNVMITGTSLNSPPEAVLDGSYSVHEGEPIFLSAAGSTDPDGDPLEYRWDIDGDGTWDTDWRTDPEIHMIWEDDDIITMAVEVTDGEYFDATSTVVTILDLSPTAEFIWSPEPQDEGEPVTFTDMSTSDPDEIVSWTWDFAGSWTSSDQNPTFTFIDDGLFDVTLTVTDDDGSTDSITHQVTIDNVAPTVSIDSMISPVTFILPGDRLEFMGSFIDPGSDTHTIEWDWGDGKTNSDSLVQNHAYADIGSYIITLTIVDDDGGMGEDTREVEVISSQGAVILVDEHIQELPDDMFKKPASQRREALHNQLRAVLSQIENGAYKGAVNHLREIRSKMDGTQGGSPKNDWIIDVQAQAWLCGHIDHIIEYLEGL